LTVPGALLLTAVLASALAAASATATVTVDHRAGRDWLVLDSRAEADVPVAPAALEAVITDYPAYPRLFPRIREARAVPRDAAVLLSETVVISALGMENINRFTLRIVRVQDGPDRVRFRWTQEATDGTIDGLEGAWTIEDRGRPGAPLTHLTYRTRSSVPVLAFGQEALVRFFLAGETQAVVEAVAKEARSR